ncbi:MAG: hypothetical protein J6023_05320 [Clostridia bacterium]|nr:hypothetical protein [Clostridia bacterium]
MAYFFLALFAVAAVTHLIGNWVEKKIICVITKPLLVSLLFAYYLTARFPDPGVLLLCALAAAWLGDVLLMPAGLGWFVAGGISFAGAHVLFIIAFAQHAAAAPVVPVILLSLVYIALTGLVLFLIRNEAPKPLMLPMGLYLICNGVMNIFAFSCLLSAPGIGTALIFAGAVSFFASDCVLVRLRYRKGKSWRVPENFVIMITYILAMFLITQGALLAGY